MVHLNSGKKTKMEYKVEMIAVARVRTTVNVEADNLEQAEQLAAEDGKSLRQKWTYDGRLKHDSIRILQIVTTNKHTTTTVSYNLKLDI